MQTDFQSVLPIFDINGHNNITGNSFSQTKISEKQEIVCDKYAKPLYLSGLEKKVIAHANLHKRSAKFILH